VSLNVEEYYSNFIVKSEIANFCRGRWVAIHCQATTSDGRSLLVRYDGDRPLVINSPDDVIRVIKRFRALRPRTIYASASLYSRLESRSDALKYSELVYAKTPTWDIDSKPEWWRATLEVVRAIIKILEEEGVFESVYIKWSGRGAHVHIHEMAISPEIYERIGPLNVAYSIVEYVIRRIKEAILRVNREFKSEIKVENLMDPQRVFTAPLSLHKQLDVSCIVFKPHEIDEFDPSWLNPLNFRHNSEWKRYVEGEADALAIKAFREIGPYPRESRGGVPQVLIEFKPIEVPIIKIGKPGVSIRRFKLEDLRLNLNPPPILKGRKFSKGASEAFYKVEDILSHYALRRISLEHAIRALKYAKDAIIPFQNYRPEEIAELLRLYGEAIKILLKLNSPDKVKQWLLSHGPPKRLHTKLDEFFK